MRALKIRVWELNDCRKGNVYTKMDRIVSVSECKDFIDKYLSKQGYWGGGETLQAVSEIHKVNIVVIRNDGNIDFAVDFNNNFKQSITLAYRNNNHYDSVSDMSEATIHSFANLLAKKYDSSKNNNNQNPIEIN